MTNFPVYYSKKLSILILDKTYASFRLCIGRSPIQGLPSSCLEALIKLNQDVRLKITSGTV